MRKSIILLGLLSFVASLAIALATVKTSWAITLYQRDGHFVMVHFWEGLVRVVQLRSDHESRFQYRIPFDGSGGYEDIFFNCWDCGGGVNVTGFMSRSKDRQAGLIERNFRFAQFVRQNAPCAVRVTGLRLPMWSLSVTSLVVALAPAASLLRRRHRARRGHCAECGYSLEGNESGICPECGTERA